MGIAKIKLEGICKSYYSETSITQALRKIDLELFQGEFVAITGESGSGKSTLLNIIGGTDSFDEGEMLIDGEPTFSYDEQDWEAYRRNRIGYVFQDYSLIEHYTAKDNIVCALMIMGKTRKDAQKKAELYLQKVGLEEYQSHRASELSSGQKQRLSIARALAKETGIIVADEPTGNLDSETGEQIVKLLKQLSNECLVIMVTHNYSQAESYVTRKIRLFDGMIISDTPVNQSKVNNKSDSYVRDNQKSLHLNENQQDTTTTKHEEKKLGQSRNGSSQHKTVPSQNKTALFFAMNNLRTQLGKGILFTSFLLIVSVVSFLLLSELYVQKDDIFTKRYSQKAFYNEDETRLIVKHSDGSSITSEDVEKIQRLTDVESVDSCDIANDINYYIEKDRDYTLIFGRKQFGSAGSMLVSFLNETHFMRSIDCISEEDLAAGRLPETMYEIVLYAEDDSVLNTKLACYFTAANLWDTGEYYKTQFTVVGIVKQETEQVYFTKDLCQMLSMHADSGIYRLCYAYDNKRQDFSQKPELIPVIGEGLSGDEVRISSKLEAATVGTTLFRFQRTDDKGKAIGDVIEQNVEVLRQQNDSTGDFLEVSQEFYDRYYTNKSNQASVYLTSYAKTDEVIEKLEKLGFYAISTYRMSTSEYVGTLVNERLKMIGISALGLLVLFIVEVLILRSLMKIRIRDFFILKFIGVRMQMMKKISYIEIGTYCCIAMLLTVILMQILSLNNIGPVREMLQYDTPTAYLLFVLYNLFLASVTVASFNHLLKGRLQA